MKPMLSGDDGQYIHSDEAEQVIILTRNVESYNGKASVGIDPNADQYPEGGHGPPRRGRRGHHKPCRGHKGDKDKGHKSHKGHIGHKHACCGRHRFSLRNILGLVAAGALEAEAIFGAIWVLRKCVKACPERHGYFLLGRDGPGLDEVE